MKMSHSKSKVLATGNRSERFGRCAIDERLAASAIGRRRFRLAWQTSVDRTTDLNGREPSSGLRNIEVLWLADSENANMLSVPLVDVLGSRSSNEPLRFPTQPPCNGVSRGSTLGLQFRCGRIVKSNGNQPISIRVIPSLRMRSLRFFDVFLALAKFRPERRPTSCFSLPVSNVDPRAPGAPRWPSATRSMWFCLLRP